MFKRGSNEVKRSSAAPEAWTKDGCILVNPVSIVERKRGSGSCRAVLLTAADSSLPSSASKRGQSQGSSQSARETFQS